MTNNKSNSNKNQKITQKSLFDINTKKGIKEIKKNAAQYTEVFEDENSDNGNKNNNSIYVDIKKEMEYQEIREMLKRIGINREFTNEQLDYIRDYAESLKDDDEDLSKSPQFIEDMAQLKQNIIKDSIITEVKASVTNELRIEFDSKFKELKKELAINYNNYIVKFKDNYVKEMEEKYENVHEKLNTNSNQNNAYNMLSTIVNPLGSIISGTIDTIGVNKSNKNIIHNNLKKNFDSYKLENNLKDLIFKYDIKKTELSETLGISRATLNNIIDNKMNVSLEIAYKISKIFGVSIDDIFIYNNK